MGIGIRHVFVVSAALGAGAFVYMVGFSPMDEAQFKRAGAIDQTPTRQGLISTIRRSMAQGQISTADRMSDVLCKHFSDDPSAYYYRALVSQQLGQTQRASENWAMLDDELSGLESWGNRYNARTLDYFRGWAKHGLGDEAGARVYFTKIADRLEEITGGEGMQYNLACYRAMAGDLDAAIEHWAAAVEAGYGSEGSDGRWWAVDPDLEPMHEMDRFWEIGSTIDRIERRGRGSEDPDGG